MAKAAAAERPQVKTKKDNTVEVQVHENWVALISYCGIAFRNGELCFGLSASVPIKIIRKKEKVRFGKENERNTLFIKERDKALVTVRVTNKWKDLIDLCTDSFPYGQVAVKMAKSEPYELIEEHTKAIIRFGHPESFPKVVRLLNEGEGTAFENNT